MREIIFRGKRTDNGEWIQGFLSKSRNTEEKPSLLKICIDYEEKGVMYSAIVDPETIGQYTGLTDKNGRKIFEGDIIKNNKGDCYEIAYLIKYTRFAPRKPGTVFAVFPLEDTTIIGNIYDNPDLL